MKLGRKPPRPDVAPPRLESYRRRALPPAPPRCDQMGGVSWRMFRNDALGCCTVSAIANGIVQRTTLGGGVPVVMPDAVVDRCYGIVGGYVPGRPETDQGAVETDVLGWFARDGVRLRDQSLETGLWAALDHANHDTLRHAVHLFGSAYIGLSLPLSAQDQMVWDVTAVGANPAASLPGSWGGHAALIAGYDPDGVDIITWGRVQRASWAFLDRYLDEAYAIFCAGEWLSTAGLSPEHLDLAALDADLRALAR